MLASAFAESRAVAVAAPAARNEQRWAYTDFGTAGKIVADGKIADLGIRTIRFENGVLLNLKKTDFEADRIRFTSVLTAAFCILARRSRIWRLS